MKKYFFMTVAAIAVLSSCSNDNEFEPNQSGKQGSLVFTATMENSEGTRAIYDSDKKCASWEAGDKISINGKTYSAQTAGTTTTFKADGDDAEPIDDKYMAYFPASLYNNGTPTLPANVTETWVDGKYNMPMYATSETASLSFTNLCGVLKITVKRGQLDKVKCITVSSTNRATSGAFNVTDNKAVLTDASNTANTVTVTYTDAVNTDATGKVFYVAIPAQTYKNLSIAVSDGVTTKVMTTKTDQDIVVARKTIYPITFVGSLTTTGTAKRTSEIDVKWIQLWKDGPKFAEYNVGAENNKAEDYGELYAWGGSQDKVDDHNTTNTGTGNLSGDDDTATKLWGSNWRMPTQTELQGFIGNSTVENVVDPNDNTKLLGKKITGKGAYASNSVFLPAAGYCDNGSALGQGGGGNYWSSTPYGSNDAYYLVFYSGSQGVSNGIRDYGYSVRAVLAK